MHRAVLKDNRAASNDVDGSHIALDLMTSIRDLLNSNEQILGESREKLQKKELVFFV